MCGIREFFFVVPFEVRLIQDAGTEDKLFEEVVYTAGCHLLAGVDDPIRSVERRKDEIICSEFGAPPSLKELEPILQVGVAIQCEPFRWVRVQVELVS